MRRRDLAAAAAVGSFVLGVGAIAGAVRGTVPAAILVLVGTATGMAAVWSVVMRRGTQVRLALPRPELARSIPAPGTDLGDAVGEFHDWSSTQRRPGERAVSGLYGLTVAVLVRFRGLSEAEATDQLADGSWTADPFAAGLLSPTLSVPSPETGVRERLLAAASRIPIVTVRNRLVRAIETESSYAAALKRAADEVARVSAEAVGREANLSDADRIEVAPDSVASRTLDRSVDEVVEETRHLTGYWNGIGVVTLLPVTVGLFVREPAVVLIGVVGIGFAGVAAVTTAPIPALAVTRTLSHERPDPGERVRVTVSLANESDSTLPDVRYVDGVPPGLQVVDGRARIGTALGPAESVTFEYTVEATRGRHRFDPGLVVTRDLFQSEERAFYVPAETELVSDPIFRPLARTPALRPVAGTFGSSLETGTGGAGTAFHSVREYRRGDPLNRIDWNRHARTGDLATLEFQEETAASVLLLVDARRAAYVASGRGRSHAVDRAVAACGRIAPTLLEGGNQVGLAAIGPTVRPEMDEPTAERCWIAPGSGRSHERAIQETLASHPQLATSVPTGSIRWTVHLRDLQRRLSTNTQVLFVTPLCDRVSVEIVRRLEARGHATSVVSPDATATETTSQRLAKVARLIRRFDLQRAGVPVVDWRADEPIERALSAGTAVPARRHRDSIGSSVRPDERPSSPAESGPSSRPGTGDRA